MDNRWSLIKRFGPITHENFVVIGGQFCYQVKKYHRRTSETIITLYKEIPHSKVDGISGWANAENYGEVLAVYTAIEDVPRDLFDLAENIQVFVSPSEVDSSSNVCGHMECKGLLTDRMVFSVSPGTIGAYIRDLCLSKEYRPSKLWFGQGDGLEELHHYSLS